MISDGELRDTMIHSPLASSSILEPRNKKPKKTIAADLLLTSLVDAFSILVIYLLLYFSDTGDVLKIDSGTELPMAAKSEMFEKNPVVKLNQGHIFVNDQEVANTDALVAKLVELRQGIAKEKKEATLEEATLIIQADRREPYEVISRAVQASSHAGFSDLHFAVIKK